MDCGMGKGASGIVEMDRKRRSEEDIKAARTRYSCEVARVTSTVAKVVSRPSVDT